MLTFDPQGVFYIFMGSMDSLDDFKQEYEIKK